MGWAAGVILGGPAVAGLAAPAPAGAELGSLRLADETRPIVASLYSLPSAYFAPHQAAELLATVRRTSPARRILAICDPPMCRALAAEARARRVELLPTALGFSPWPRDPVTLAVTGDGMPVLLGRPNAQAGREIDARLAEFLAEALPRDLAARSARAPVPFHGGQMLGFDGALWLSLHSVEPRVLELLGLERVPVASFLEPQGLARYAHAARRAAHEIASLFGRRAEFVHPLPAGESDAGGAALARDLGGGAGVDLDTYLTLVPAGGGPGLALVGDLALGEALLTAVAQDDLDSLAGLYDLAPRGAVLRAALRAAQGEPPGAALGRYLDTVAGHLSRRGLRVRRLPLLRVPTALLADRAGVTHREFLLGWNNVVLEATGGEIRAEGFAAGLPAGDEAARQAFAAAGVRLVLLPPLVHSVVLNGGYRCASNHLRRASDP